VWRTNDRLWEVQCLRRQPLRLFIAWSALQALRRAREGGKRALAGFQAHRIWRCSLAKHRHTKSPSFKITNLAGLSAGCRGCVIFKAAAGETFFGSRPRRMKYRKSPEFHRREKLNSKYTDDRAAQPTTKKCVPGNWLLSSSFVISISELRAKYCHKVCSGQKKK